MIDDYVDLDDDDYDDVDGSGVERPRDNESWLEKLQLPVERFCDELRVALAEKLPLQKHMKGHLLQALYDELTQHTYYPTNFQYSEVINQLLMTFPYLKMDLAHRDAKYLWMKSLRTKFRNHRRRHDFNLIEVQMKRKKLD